MLLTLLLVLQDPLAVRPDTIRPAHDALHYDVTLVLGDTGTHILGQVQTTWRLGSAEPLRIELDTSLRVVRVLMDGRENTRLSRTIFAREADGVYLPHDKAAGDSLVIDDPVSRPGEGRAHHRHQPVWPAGHLRRQLAGPGPQMAADPGSPERQGDGGLPCRGPTRDESHR